MMDLRAARAEPGAVQPRGHVSFPGRPAGAGTVRWRASSHAKNPVKSPRRDFSAFLAPVRVPQCRRFVLLRDTVRCHFRLGVLGGHNLYPLVFM